MPVPPFYAQNTGMNFQKPKGLAVRLLADFILLSI